MSHRSIRIAAAALLLAVAGAATLSAGSPERAGRRGRHSVQRCLAAAELTDAQKETARAAFEAAKPSIEAARRALRADHEALRALLDAENPDAAAVGAAALKVEEGRKAIRAEVRKATESLKLDLTEEQRAMLEGCMRGKGMREPPPATEN